MWWRKCACERGCWAQNGGNWNPECGIKFYNSFTSPSPIPPPLPHHQLCRFCQLIISSTSGVSPLPVHTGFKEAYGSTTQQLLLGLTPLLREGVRSVYTRRNTCIHDVGLLCPRRSCKDWCGGGGQLIPGVV